MGVLLVVEGRRENFVTTQKIAAISERLWEVGMALQKDKKFTCCINFRSFLNKVQKVFVHIKQPDKNLN